MTSSNLGVKITTHFDRTNHSAIVRPRSSLEISKLPILSTYPRHNSGLHVNPKMASTTRRVICRSTPIWRCPNWRMRTIRLAFQKLDISQASLKCSIQREVFLAPLAKHHRSYLRGDAKAVRYLDRPNYAVVEYFKGRWMIPRSLRTTEWRAWTRQNSRDLLSELFREPIGARLVEFF